MAIGVRVGVAVGVNVGVAVGASSDEIGGASNASGVLVLAAPTDSNGQGPDIAPDEWDETFDPMTEITAVPYRKRWANNSNDPIILNTDITTGGVRPFDVASSRNSGWQISFAQEAVRAGFACALGEYSIFGVKALQSKPTATYPTQPPAGPNYWTQVTQYADSLEASLSAKTRGLVNSLGGNDGFDVNDANACNASLTAIVNGAISKWGSGIRLVMFRNPDYQAIASSVPFLTTIQAAQDAVAAAFPTNVALVVTADTTGHSDHLHLTGDDSVIVGQRAFYALLDLLGVSRVRPTKPQIVGWGPQYTSGGAYSPIPPGCGIPGDLEVLIGVTQSAGGSSTRISSPTVAGGGTAWIALNDAVLGDTQIQSSQTTTSRLGIWARAVTANRAITATPLTTVPSNGLTINGGRIITVRGPNALTTANIDLIRYSVNNAFQTGLTLTGLTTGFANEGIIPIACGYRTNPTSNPVTMSGGNVTGLAKAFGGNRPAGAGGDFITNAAWNSALAAASATGNITVAFALATLGVGALLGVKP